MAEIEMKKEKSKKLEWLRNGFRNFLGQRLFRE